MSVPDDLLARVEDLLDLDPGMLALETSLDAVEGWDSVNQMRILVELEKAVGASLHFDDFMAASTVAELMRVAHRSDPRDEAPAGADAP